MFGSRLISKLVKKTCMVAERSQDPPLPVHTSFLTFSSPRFLATMVSAAADDYVPSLMADVDPETGLTYTPAKTLGEQLFMYKLLATGAVSLTQCLFYKWRKWQKKAQQQRNEETTLAIYSQPRDDNSPLGFDFERLDEQDDHQQRYSQLLADNKRLKEQIREQKSKLEQKDTDHTHSGASASRQRCKR